MSSSSIPSRPGPKNPRAWLDYLPALQRTHGMTRFLLAVRAGADTPAAVVAAVKATVAQRLAAAQRIGDEVEADKFVLMASVLTHYPNEALALARYALDHEASKAPVRSNKPSSRPTSLSDTQPATEAQLAFLRDLGYDGPVDSKRHASDLIGRLRIEKSR
jgi:hypothetical protein